MHFNQNQKAVLVVDIGNTNIVCAVYNQGEMKWAFRLDSRRERTCDEYYSLLYPLMQDYPMANIVYAVLGSVVPELTRVWRHLLQKYSKAQVFEISALSPIGLKFKVENPGYIGADLVANAFATWKKYAQNAIVIDMGTATTIQVVSKAGVFNGAIIAPGLKTGAINLFSKAAQLNEFEMTTPPVLLGTSTQEAVLSGVMHGHALMLEGFIQRLKLQYFDLAPILTVITGGMADLLKPLVPSLDTVDKSLTLDGYYLAAEKLISGL